MFYSYEEKKIGKWIDGKDLYQKTIITPIVNGTTEYTITSGPFENVIFIEGLLDNNYIDGGLQFPIVTDGGYSSGTSKRYQIEKDTTENNSVITAHMGGISFSEGDTYNLYTTIRYTKY